MKNWKRIRGILAAAALLAMLHTTAALADTTVSITGGDNLQVGNPVAVTVTLQNETSMDESDLFITYDSTLLQFVSGDGAEEESDGRIRIRGDFDEPVTQQIWTLQFTALAEGSVSVSAEDVWVMDTDGNTDAEVTVNAGTVNIAQTAADAQTTEADATEQAADATADDALSALEQEIANDGTMSCLIGTEKWYVAESFGTDILWEHFVMTTQFYKGVEVAAGKLNNAEYYVLLVRSEDGSQEKFAHYDESTKTFSEVTCLQLDTDSAIYVTDPAEEEIPSYFTETEYNGYRVWQITEDVAVSEYGADVTEFYMIYGYNQEGASGWFLWDPVANGAVRYVEMTPTSQQSSAVTADTSDATLSARYDNLLSRFDFMVTCIKYIAVALIALLLILLIVNLSDKGGTDEKKEKKEKKEKEKKEKKEKKQEAADASKTVIGETKKIKKPKEAPKSAAAAADDFIDDYVEDDDDLAVPQNEAEEAAIGVLKPVSESIAVSDVGASEPAAVSDAGASKPAAVSDAGASKPAADPATKKRVSASATEGAAVSAGASKPAADPATKKRVSASATEGAAVSADASKPAADSSTKKRVPASARKSMQDSLAGLSQKLNKTMKEEKKPEPDDDELTFIDLGDE